METGFFLIPITLFIFLGTIFLFNQYKRCPIGKLLVVYGKIGGDEPVKILDRDGIFVIPIIQDYAFLSLEPITTEINLEKAPSSDNILLNVPAKFTFHISNEHELRINAVRFLGMSKEMIGIFVSDAITEKFRSSVSSMSVKDIFEDREKFIDLIIKNVNMELKKSGLEVIDVNIGDITDESGYIEEMGRPLAEEAINRARIIIDMEEKVKELIENNADIETIENHITNNSEYMELVKKEAIKKIFEVIEEDLYKGTIKGSEDTISEIKNRLRFMQVTGY